MVNPASFNVEDKRKAVTGLIHTGDISRVQKNKTDGHNSSLFYSKL